MPPRPSCRLILARQLLCRPLRTQGTAGSVNVHLQRVPLFYVAPTVRMGTMLESVRTALGGFPGFVFVPAQQCSRDDLLTVHTAEYVGRMLMPAPHTVGTAGTLGGAAGEDQEMGPVEISLLAVGAALQALHAIKHGGHAIAGTLTGGFHHVARDHEATGCVFNDLAVAAVTAIQKYDVQRVLICDLDMQHGDGTASIFADDPRVVTFSMHAHSECTSSAHSDYDVNFDEETTPDAAYVDMLRSFLNKLLDTANPQLIIYQAGVSHLSRQQTRLTRKGLQERNQLVYQAALQRQVPVLVTFGQMNGGPISDPCTRTLVAEAHCDVYRSAYQSIITHNHRQFFF